MYTPTLGEVRTAIRTNNRKEAATMLQTLIQKKPSADAWFLAAKLAKNPNKKVEYLRTALFLNPKHHKSKDYLRELGEEVGGVHNVFLSGFAHLLQEQFSNSPLLRNLSPRFQFVVGTSILILFVILFGVVASSLMSLRGPAVSAEGPATPAIEYVTQASILDHFSASTLDILFTEEARNNTVGKDIITLDIRDVGNRSRVIEIFVYDSVPAIFADQTTLNQYAQTSNVLSKDNIVVVYPNDLSDISANVLASLLETVQNPVEEA